ncbi:MAG TPA: peptidylprolyl isomerase, partial [Puia sp.]|nr:peptidylprolyl isomerase [Puia sp.]
AQTLFTYGSQQVSKQEFLQAYKKNNTNGKATAKSYKDYLDLYTRYKLKVKAAYDMKLDTLANQLADLQNFRSQIVDQYMSNEASVNRLINEAFTRSQKDIHVQHIFIGFPKNPSPSDTLKAFQKAMSAYAELSKGKDFGKVAAEYSEDPFVKSNSGDLGYITVFDIPYGLETLAYTTPSGKFSKPTRGKTGYHIIKNLGERKAIGKVKVAQILLVYPYHPNDAAKMETRQRADSIYQVILKGGDFIELARHFSGDNLTYQSGGEMPEFGVGKYDPAFESAAFNLKNPGDLSKPVQTDFGYHIIKLIGRKPVSTEKDKKTTDAFRSLVLNDSRIETAKKEMLQTILNQIQYKKATYNESHLWVYTDSSLQNRTLPSFSDLKENTVLFS